MLVFRVDTEIKLFIFIATKRYKDMTDPKNSLY